jgi:hypothetical protein
MCTFAANKKVFHIADQCRDGMEAKQLFIKYSFGLWLIFYAVMA